MLFVSFVENLFPHLELLALNRHAPRDFVPATCPTDDAPAQVGHVAEPLLHQEGAGMVGAGPALR